MKRDAELMRNLLFEFEEQEDWLIVEREVIGMSGEKQRRLGHVKLLCDAGLVASISKGGSYRLTNDGHDYIEAIRDDGAWSKVKDTVAKTGGSATLEIMKQIAVGFLKKKISDQTGLNL